MEQKLRWRMHENRKPGPVKMTADGREPLYVVVDEDGFFETEGQPNFPLYVFAKRVKH